MRKSGFLLLVLLLTAAALRAQPASGAPDAVFAALRGHWAQALRGRQVEALVEAYLPEAGFTAPDGKAVQGRAALQAAFAQHTDAYQSRVLFFLSKVEEKGETATDTGQFRELRQGRADGRRQMIQGGYVTEYRHVGGKWLIEQQKFTAWGQPIALNFAAHPAVALTFDDLPAGGSLPKGMSRVQIATELSSKLKAAQLEGSYGFVNGILMEKSPDAQQAMRTWLAAGMNIGSHTWSHPNLSEIAAEAFTADIARNEPSLEAYGQMRDWKWLRYPYLYEGNTLEKRRAVRQWLSEHGYRVAEVTLDFGDYAWNNAYGRCLAQNDRQSIQWLHDSYLANAAEFIQLGREEEMIAFGHEIPNVLLLHETAFTAHMLPELIDLLKKEGFVFKPLAEVERDPAYSLDPDAALEYGGTLPDQFMDGKRLPYPPFDPKPMERLNAICK